MSGSNFGMKNVLNGRSIVSAWHNSYGRNKANGRTKIKGGVRILADKSTKIKRLRLSRETIIQLDALIAARRIKIHAHLRARVFLYVWCIWNPFSGFDDIILSNVRSFLAWGRNSKGRSLRSRDLATFDCHYLLYLIILRLISATSASQMHLRSLRSLR